MPAVDYELGGHSRPAPGPETSVATPAGYVLKRAASANTASISRDVVRPCVLTSGCAGASVGKDEVATGADAEDRFSISESESGSDTPADTMFLVSGETMADASDLLEELDALVGVGDVIISSRFIFL